MALVMGTGVAAFTMGLMAVMLRAMAVVAAITRGISNVGRGGSRWLVH